MKSSWFNPRRVELQLGVLLVESTGLIGGCRLGGGQSLWTWRLFYDCLPQLDELVFAVFVFPNKEGRKL